eukprot:1158425-Pelagomonas_calceolata.AAC.2
MSKLEHGLVSHGSCAEYCKVYTHEHSSKYQPEQGLHSLDLHAMYHTPHPFSESVIDSFTIINWSKMQPTMDCAHVSEGNKEWEQEVHGRLKNQPVLILFESIGRSEHAEPQALTRFIAHEASGSSDLDEKSCRTTQHPSHGHTGHIYKQDDVKHRGRDHKHHQNSKRY